MLDKREEAPKALRNDKCVNASVLEVEKGGNIEVYIERCGGLRIAHLQYPLSLRYPLQL